MIQDHRDRLFLVGERFLDQALELPHLGLGPRELLGQRGRPILLLLLRDRVSPIRRGLRRLDVGLRFLTEIGRHDPRLGELLDHHLRGGANVFGRPHLPLQVLSPLHPIVRQPPLERYAVLGAGDKHRKEHAEQITDALEQAHDVLLVL